MNRTKSPFKHNEDGHLLLSEVAHKEAHEGEVDNVVTNDLSVENVSNYSKKKVKEEKKEVKVKEDDSEVGSTFTNKTGSEYIKKENGWNVKDDKTGEFRLVNQKMFYDNQLKGSKPEAKKTYTLPRFQHQKDDGTGEQHDFSLVDGRWIHKVKGDVTETAVGKRLTAKYKDYNKKEEVEYDIQPFIPEVDADGNNIHSDNQNKVYSINNQLLDRNLIGTIEGDNLISELGIAEKAVEDEEYKVKQDKGREEVGKFNEDDLKEISTASDLLNDDRDDKLNGDYGNLGFTFKNGIITSLDGTTIDVTDKEEGEVKEFLENNAVYFKNQSNAAAFMNTKGGGLNAVQRADIKLKSSEETISAVTEIMSDELETALDKSITNFKPITPEGGFQVDEITGLNTYVQQSEVSIGDISLQQSLTQVAGEQFEAESKVTNNLNNAVAIEANRQINLKKGENNSLEKNAELYYEEVVALRSEVEASFMEDADFLTKNQTSDEDYEEEGAGKYIATEYFDKDGNVINQDAYDEKTINLKQNRVYQNISKSIESENRAIIIQKNVDEYADGRLSNNVFMNTKTQEINKEALTDQTKELDDREKKLLIKGELLSEEYNKAVDGMKTNRKWLENNTQKSIQSEIDVILKGEYTTEEEREEAQLKIDGIINNYNSHRAEFQSSLDEVKGISSANLALQVDYKELFKDGEDFANYANHIARNTQWGTQAATSFGIGALGLVSDGISFIGMVGDIPVTLLDELSEDLDDGNIVKSMIETSQIVTGDGFAGEETTTGFKVIKDAIGTLQKELADQVEIPPSFEDANSLGDWAEYGVVAVAGQMPQIAAMCLVPGGAYVMGAISAGGQYDQFEQDRILYDKTGGLYGNNVNFLTAVSGSVAVGAVNYYSEKITLGQIKGVKEILKTPVGKTVGLKYLRQNVFNPKVLAYTATDLGMEAGSEALATLGENGINILAGTQGVDLYDNVIESAATGFLLSGTMKSPLLFKHAYAPFASQNSTQAMDSNFLKINDLGEKLMNTDVPSEIESIKVEIAKITQENTKLMELDIQRVDALNDLEKRDLINIESDNRKLKQAASEVTKDESLSKEQKQEQLTQINEKLNKNGVRKQEVLDKYPDDVVKEKYKHTMNSVKDQVKIIKDYGGPEINVQEGNTKKFGEVLKAAGVDPVYQTRYGGLMPVLDNYGKVKSYDMFVNKETSLKDGMFTTGAHELLHGIMYQTLKQDNNTQEVVGDALLEALTDAGATISTDSDFNERINSYTKSEGQGEEIMAITSEALMKGEITLPESALDKLGNVYRRVIKNKTNRDIEFNKPKDVLNFIKDYNYSIEKNMSQPAITRMAAKGITGEMVSKFQAAKKNADAKASFSRNVIQEIIAKPDLKTDFDNLVQDANGVQKYKTKEDFKQSVDYVPAYKMIAQSNKLDNLITAGVSDNVSLENMDEFVKKAKAKLAVKFAKTFDPKVHKSLFGWLTGAEGKSAIYEAQESEGGRPKIKAKKVFKQTPLDAINSLIPEGITTQADYYKLLDEVNPKDKNGKKLQRIYDSKRLAPVIEAYVRSRSVSDEMSLENIENVKKRLMNFNPEAKREDGSTVGMEGFGESIFANTRFGKLDAAEALYKAGVKRDQEVRGDDVTGTGKTVFEGLTTDGTTSTQSTVKGPKARILENLSDVGLENMGEIDAVVMAEVEALIEQNPENLEQQLTSLIEKEFRKLIVADMGKISRVEVGQEIVNGKKKPIYKVKISDDYKAFHALEYDNMVNSLSDAVIKKNYNNLFEIEQTSREKDKKVDPVTGKVTYPGKGIYTINKGNKAKWTKFFTEGGYTTLKDRQKKIATLVSKSKAKTAVDNYIAENKERLAQLDLDIARTRKDKSLTKKEIDKKVEELESKKSKYINKALDAKLRLVSENLDNQKNQVTSFDKVQFSKESPSKLGSIIEAKKFLEVIKKEVDALYATNKFIDKGRAFEQATINRIKKWKIAGLDVAVEIATEEGGLADVTLRVHTVKGDYGIEMKYGVTKPTDVMLSAQSVPYSLENGRMDSKNKYKGVIDMDSFIESNTERLNAYYEFVNEAVKLYNAGTLTDGDGLPIGDRLQIPLWKTTKDSVPDFIHTLAKRYGANLVNEVNSGGQIEVDLYDVASVAYLNKSKPSQAIEFFGEGLLSLNKDNNPFGLPLLEGTALVTLRLSANTRKAATNKYGLKMLSVSPRVIPTPTEITSKAEGSLLNKEYMSSRPAMKLANIVKQNNDVGISFSKAVNKSRLTNKDTEVKGISVLDFDDTLATSKSMIRYTTPDGTKGTLNAEQYASTYQELSDQGYKWDFSEFNEVVDGKTAPLFNKALKLQEKFGATDMFVLTARPAEAAPAIFKFLQANGLDIPLKNITGLANSTSEAKALWMADKVGEGYNDFYFADDALQNVQAVQNMLDQFDVKSKVQQAKIKFSKSLDVTMNDILEQTTGMEAEKRFSDVQAKLRGKGFKFRGIIPASAQDFAGLLYNFIGKGKKGEQQFEILKKALIDPFARGVDELNTSRQDASEDYRALLKEFPEVKKDLNKKISSFGSDNFKNVEFTVDQAVRIYLFNKAGFEVPGLSARDLKTLVEFVETDGELQAFAESLSIVSKKEDGYAKPGEYWLTETITSDLTSDGAIGDARADFLAEWKQNADQIFSKENLNKIEVIYGAKFREALKDVLYRMETGRNRPSGGNRLLNGYMNWVNGSVGAIMFFNIRSAVLQTISATNYINWSDNNPLKAAAAFANQKQFWSDFSTIFNSSYLRQRRSGNRRGVNEADLSAAVAGVGAFEQTKAAIRYLLKIGFLPTQIADSFAIASGGASFYRNRVKSLIKKGMLKADAEKQAFLDFQETTEVSQQSARPDMISQQQANPLGRLLLAFQNTPMQYGRIMNKAFRDVANGRGDTKTHVSKIIYYGVVQSVVFTALQSALFAVVGSDDDDEKKEMIDKKSERMINSMIDTWLTALGYGGKAIATVKNTIIEYKKQRDKDVDDNFISKSDHAYTLLQALSFTPPIGAKLRKIYQSIQTEKFNRDLMKERGLTLDNPAWSMIGNVIEGVTNVPLGRLAKKMLNIDNAMDSSNETWQRLALMLGWSTWDLGIKDPDLVSLGADIKEAKKKKKTKETEIKKEEKKRAKLKEKYPNKTEKEIDIAVKSKELFSLSKQTQVDILKQLKLSDKEIKNLKKEQNRTDKIAELYEENSELIDGIIETSKTTKKEKPKKKEKVKLSKKEKNKKSLFKMKKRDQINLLLELGYSPRKVNTLRYEKDRVEMIVKLQNKKSK